MTNRLGSVLIDGCRAAPTEEVERFADKLKAEAGRAGGLTMGRRQYPHVVPRPEATSPGKGEASGDHMSPYHRARSYDRTGDHRL